MELYGSTNPSERGFYLELYGSVNGRPTLLCLYNDQYIFCHTL